MYEQNSLLSIHDLTVTLPANSERSYAVDHVNLHIKENDIFCLLGESGSGKSVLARAIMGLLPTPPLRVEGEIFFQGNNLLHASPKQLRRLRGQKIAMIFQDSMSALNPLMTIGHQIEELLKIHLSLPKNQRKTRILELMEEVKLQEAERIYHAYPHQISGGQRQRAMIVMALILRPCLLIADEPTTALDVTTQAQILDLIKTLQRKHQTSVLFITHDFGVVAEIANHVAIMHQGQLVESGSVKEVLGQPQHPYSQSLIAAVPKLEQFPEQFIEPNEIKTTLEHLPLKDEADFKAKSCGKNKEIAQGGDPKIATDTLTPQKNLHNRRHMPIILQIKALTKSYPSTKKHFWRRHHTDAQPVLKATDLTLHAGEIIGIIGESGCGKSTLARCITRLIDADSGHIILEGKDISQLSRADLRHHRQKIQMIFQDPYSSLNPRQNIAQHIVQGPVAQGIAMKEALHHVSTLLKQVGLDPLAAYRYPHEFSGGQRQRIAIARALALKPDILVADEPVSSLDVSMQSQILKLLLDIRDRFGLAILFITHDLRIAAQICDKIMVMSQGEIVESGNTVELFNTPQHRYTQNLLTAIPGGSWYA